MGFISSIKISANTYLKVNFRMLCKNDFNNMGYSKILRILGKCAPLKKYHLNDSHANFMTKESKFICSKLLK